MQLYFIRHAQSTNNALYDQANEYSGRSEDPELTDIGIRQAEILAEFLHQPKLAYANNHRDPQNLRGFNLTHLYTSPMVRAVATATIVARALGLPLAMWIDLHEGGGIYLDDSPNGQRLGMPGKNRAYFQTHYPDLELPDCLGEDGWWNRPYEERPERRARAQRFWSELTQCHGMSSDRVAVFSHGGFHNYFLSAMLNLLHGQAQPAPETAQAEEDQNIILGAANNFWFSLCNCAITRIDFDSEEVRLVYQNRVDFMPGELIT